MSAITLRPNAAGDYSQWTASTSSNYECVDEAVADDGDYVTTQNESDRVDLYNLETDSALSGVTIQSLKVYVRANKDGSGSQIPVDLEVGVKSGSTTDWAAPFDLTTDFSEYNRSWSENPDDGQAWQKSDIDSLQIGIRGNRHTAGRRWDPFVSQIYAVVEYLSGDCVISPTPLSVVAGGYGPMVILGSLTLVSGAAGVISAVTISSVILGSHICTVAAVVIITENVSPIVVLGDTTAAADAAGALTNTNDPYVILGSLNLHPGSAPSKTAGFDPQVVDGSLDVVCQAAVALARGINAVVVHGSIAATPACAMAQVSSLIQGVRLSSVWVIPQEAEAVACAGEAVVQLGSIWIDADIACLSTSVQNPALVLGSTTAVPQWADIVAGVENPQIILSSTSVTPEFCMVRAVVNIQDVILGSLSLSATSAASVCSYSDSQIILGSVTVDTAACTSFANTYRGGVLGGTSTVFPGWVRVGASAVGASLCVSFSLQTRVNAVTLSQRPTVTFTPLLIMQDYTGHWLFEDGSCIGFGLDETFLAMQVENRHSSLQLENRAGVYVLKRLLLEDVSGYWLFDDDDLILAGPGDLGTGFYLSPRTTAASIRER